MLLCFGMPRVPCQLIMHVYRWNTPRQSPLSCGNDLSSNEMRRGVFSQGEFYDLYDALVFLWVPCQVLRREPGDLNDDLVFLSLKFIVVKHQPVLPLTIVLCSMFWNKCATACGDSLNGGNFRKKNCQRHNGPEGWVHLSKVILQVQTQILIEFHLQNLD